MKKARISLPTIHCESCVKLIGMTLKNIPGIKNTTFDIEKRSLVVEFDDSISGQSVVDAIANDAGYEAKLESEEDNIPLIRGTERVSETELQKTPPTPLIRGEPSSAIATFEIGGMHCSSCSLLIEKSLKQTL